MFFICRSDKIASSMSVSPLLQTVIENGIMTNQIPALQHYLHYRGDHSKKPFGQIKSDGLQFAVNYIRHDNMRKGKELISKLVRQTNHALLKESLTLDQTILTWNNPEKKSLFENIVGKGENAGTQHFLLFPQCFLSFPK